MRKNECWAVIDGKGDIWHWTLTYSRKIAITIACGGGISHKLLRKSAWAALKRESGCRIIKVQITKEGWI